MYSLVTKSETNWKSSKSGDMNKLNTFCLFKTDNEYGFPEVVSSDFSPSALLPFNLSKNKRQGDSLKTVHFFLDDYKFEPLWSDPRKFIDLLRFYNGMISPTYSVWSNQPYALNLYNIYRSRWITRFYQEQGINVLVDVRWAGADTYDICFSGIAKHSSVIINTVGTRLLSNREMFREGFTEMLNRIEPSKLFIYGEYLPLKFEDYFENVTYFDSFWKERREQIKEKR